MRHPLQEAGGVSDELARLAGHAGIHEVGAALHAVRGRLVRGRHAHFLQTVQQAQRQRVHDHVDRVRNPSIRPFRRREGEARCAHGLHDVGVFLPGDGTLTEADEQADAGAAARGQEEHAAYHDLGPRRVQAATLEDFAFREFGVGARRGEAVDLVAVGFFVEVENLAEAHGYRCESFEVGLEAVGG